MQVIYLIPEIVFDLVAELTARTRDQGRQRRDEKAEIENVEV